MSTVNGVSGSGASGSVSGASTTTAKDMEDRFMTLFLAQLRHQDPLSPMQNAEMTSQLAQMNMVSGIESLNGTLKTLLGSYDEALSLQAANLVGKNVLVPGKNMVLTENGGLAGIQIDGPADKVEVVIKDANGKEVAKQNLGQQDAGSLAFVWDGKGMEGETLPEGNYTISVSASLAGSPVKAEALQVGTVSALVRGKDGAFLLEVAGVGSVGLDQVRQVF